MNQEIKKEWRTALRSGDYLQGTGALCSVDSSGVKKFCCLGVLCEILKDRLGLKVATILDSISGINVVAYGEKERIGLLPSEVMKFAGLKDTNPTVRGMCLSNWNDVDKKSFEEIADMIEEEL